AMAQAAEAAGLSEIRLFTQVNQFARRILEGMGLDRLERDIATLAAAAPETAESLRQARAVLGEQVRELVDRNLVLFSRGENEKLREEALRNIRFGALDRRDLARMRTIVRAMAKRLRDRYARLRRRRNRGQLDARRTIRHNAGWGGVPFITHWKRRHVEKPRLLVLCDVSGSVAAAAEFLLLLLYALNEALSDIRAFAFSGSLIEVSPILETMEIDAAIGEILRRVGFGSSNYGQALADFEAGWMDLVTRRTTILILGDGRGNFTDPRADIVKQLGERARRVIWLNPEARTSWGTGDSEMDRYAPYCTLVTQCNTLRRLERVVAELLAEER
ncbi:MAG: VWA domain-containing protein, partial [Aliidongia sp.]